MFNMFQQHNDNGLFLRLSSLLPVVWQETRKRAKNKSIENTCKTGQARSPELSKSLKFAAWHWKLLIARLP